MENNIALYSPFPTNEKDCIQLVENIFDFYSVFKTCLESIPDLVNVIEYGFLSENKVIVQEGEKGYDIFLICDQKVDVIVHDQILLSMETPALIGEKALVEPNNTRAATIRITPKHTCLVLKVPLGKFLEDIEDQTIPDSKFTLQKSIFCNFFTRIQKRLLDNISVQKNLWEKANNALTHLNTKLLIRTIETKKELDWSIPVQKSISQYLKENFNINWKIIDTVDSIDPKNLHMVLLQLLHKKHPFNKYLLSEGKYKARLKAVWLDWLEKIAAHIVSCIEPENLPVSLGEIQLFNPSNYHLNLKNTLSNIESTLISKQALEKDNFNQFLKANATGDLWLDIFSYFLYLDQSYTLEKSEHFKASTAQKLTLIVSKYENDFNMSIAQMQEFIKKIQSLSLDFSQLNLKKTKSIQTQKAFQIISRALQLYNTSHIATQNTEFYYEVGLYPSFLDLINIVTTPFKSAIQTAFDILDKEYQLTLSFPAEELQRYLYVCCIHKNQQVSVTEFKNHLWIPLSENMNLQYEQESFTDIAIGRLVASIGWQKKENQEEKTKENQESTNYTAQFAFANPVDEHSDATQFAFFIPLQELPWMRSSNPPIDIFEKEYMPFMQWIIDKYIQHIEQINEQLTSISNYKNSLAQSKLNESHLKQFETEKLPISTSMLESIKELLQQNFKITLATTVQELTSKQFSTDLYKQFVTETKESMKQVSTEEISNYSYTLWRQALSEIVKLIIETDSSFFATNSQEEKKNFLLILQQSLVTIFKQYNLDTKDITIDQEKISLDITAQLILLKQMVKQRLQFFNDTLIILGQIVQSIFQEIQKQKKEIDLLDHIPEGEETKQQKRQLQIYIAALRQKLFENQK